MYDNRRRRLGNPVSIWYKLGKDWLLWVDAVKFGIQLFFPSYLEVMGLTLYLYIPILLAEEASHLDHLVPSQSQGRIVWAK